MADHGLLAPTDRLTGIATRQTALAQMRCLVETGSIVHCLVIDVDHFGALNAHLGTTVADQILQMVATSLADVLPGLSLGRLAGDQFIAFGTEQPTDIEHSTLTAFAIETSAGPLTIELSAGQASTVVAGPSAEALLGDALGALQVAKAEGRQRVVVATRELRESQLQRRLLANEAKTALENNELVPWAQPIYNLTSGRPAGFELLARWPRHEGFESPGLFIPIIEALGFSSLLGEFMVREAATLLQRLDDEGHGDTFVTLNVSAKHIAEPLLPSLIGLQLERRNIEPSRMIIELTETQQLPDSRAGRTAIERLRSLGIGVATDDVGAGWSTLTQMINSPFTHVKTDRSLIEATALPGGQQLIEAIRTIAESAGRVAIAEGIESEAELEAVRAAGFTLGQGWLLQKPQPIEAALVLLDH